MKLNLIVLSVLLLISMLSCDSSSDSTHYTNNTTQSSSYSSQSHSSNNYTSNESDDEDDNNDDHKSVSNDGTHSATVDYYNPQTGYSQTYSLDVEVEDGQVKQINFPNGGYLDDSHITPKDIEDGHAEVEGEDGKTYDVTVDD